MGILLEGIHVGYTQAPRKTILYGGHGIGKSTFAAGAPGTIFMDIEGGLSRIDCHSLPRIHDYKSCIESLRELYQEDHPYKTLAIDTLDVLETLVWAHVCSQNHVKTIDIIDWGKGYAIASDYWVVILKWLDALVAHREMEIILLAHLRVERLELPGVEAYDRYVPRLHRKALALFTEWADEVLFANRKIYTKEVKNGFDEKKSRALPVGIGDRMIYTSFDPSHEAKNRLGLPIEIPLDWALYQQARDDILKPQEKLP